MSEKVEVFKPTLTKSVADGIKFIKKNHKLGFVYDLYGISKASQKTGDEYDIVCRWATFSRDNMVLYFHALVNGFEVELSPEDKVRERYEHYLSCDDRKYRGMGIGIKEAIGILGIKIKGVNT